MRLTIILGLRFLKKPRGVGQIFPKILGFWKRPQNVSTALQVELRASVKGAHDAKRTRNTSIRRL